MPNIKLKNANGVEQTYNDVNTVKIPNARGMGYVEFSRPIKLGTPTITLSNGIISWSAITNATIYIIYKNNIFLSATQSTSYDVSTFVGNYKIKATASGYIDSDFSNEIVIALPKPSDLTGTKWKMNNTIEAIPYPGPSKIYDITGSMVSGTYTVSSTSEHHTFARRLSNDVDQITFPLTIVWNEPGKRAVSYHSKQGWGLVVGSSEASTYTAFTDDVILSIAGGNDVTNSEYIDWLWSNAERIE